MLLMQICEELIDLIEQRHEYTQHINIKTNNCQMFQLLFLSKNIEKYILLFDTKFCQCFVHFFA